jgi:flavin reductase (DIM6/NTAB) family NADH-FMN oxidoreductase RutF
MARDPRHPVASTGRGRRAQDEVEEVATAHETAARPTSDGGGGSAPGSPRLDAFFDRVDYPFYVVTARAPDAEMSGCLAGFVTQCSIDPPNFVVCISRENHTFGVAVRSAGIGLHLLGSDQEALARHFAETSGDRVDEFASVAWGLGAAGAPLLEDVAVRLEGRILGHAPVGDHDAFLVRARGASAGARRGLLSVRSAPPLRAAHPA